VPMVMMTALKDFPSSVAWSQDRHIRQELVALLLSACVYALFPPLTAVLAARTRTVSVSASLVVSTGTYLAYGALVFASAMVGQALAEEELRALQPHRAGEMAIILAAACFHAAVSAEFVSMAVRHVPGPCSGLVPSVLLLALFALAVCSHVGGVFGVTNLSQDLYYASAQWVHLSAGITALPVLHLYYAILMLSAPSEGQLHCEGVACGVPWTLISLLSQWLVLVLLLLLSQVSSASMPRKPPPNPPPTAHADLEGATDMSAAGGAGAAGEGEAKEEGGGEVVVDVEGVWVEGMGNVTLHVKKGMCLGILGVEGCGQAAKTNLLQLLSGHTTPCTGHVVLHTPLPVARERGLYHELTVRENLRVAAALNLGNASWGTLYVASFSYVSHHHLCVTSSSI